MRREIDAPDTEWLSLPQLAKWLGIGQSTVRALVSAKEIPPPVKLGHKTHVWHWQDAVAISISLTWRQRIAEAHERENEPQ